MNVVQYKDHGTADVLAIAKQPDPVVGQNEILVRLEAIGVTPFDCKLRSGSLRNYFTVPFPFIPGRDGVGRVVDKGNNVSMLSTGDVVAFRTSSADQGSYSELIAVPQHQAVKVPDNLSVIEAAAILNAGLSAMIMVATANLKPGDHVLVHAAAGAVGGLLVQLCRQRGAHVSGTCRSANCNYVEGLGAHRAIAYDKEDFWEILTDQDVVFDLMGGNVHDRSYGVLKKCGRLVWLVADPFIERGAEFGVTVERAIVTDNLNAIQSIFDMAAAGLIKAQVAQVLPLSKAAEAHRLMDAGLISRGRIILLP